MPPSADTHPLDHFISALQDQLVPEEQSYTVSILHSSIRIMIRGIQCVLLVSVAVFLAVVNGASLQQIPFFVSMAEGDSVEIAEHGPFTFSAACDSSAVTLDVLIEASQEDYVFTDYTSPINLLPGNTTYCPGVFSESSYGNDYADGGFVSASGYYVGWDGESVIGLHLASGATQPVLGDNVSCIVSGVVKLIEKS